ncbi:MAG: transposase [Candidatus Uhrbacteria bacterium]|nr:transposase [Candidatus Uhrbacteria bacterium]
MTKRSWSVEEKAQIVLEGLTTNIQMSELCRRHNLNHAQYYAWRTQFLEAGKRGLVRGATTSEDALQTEINELKQLVADLSIANSVLKKTFLSGKGGKS